MYFVFFFTSKFKANSSASSIGSNKENGKGRIQGNAHTQPLSENLLLYLINVFFVKHSIKNAPNLLLMVLITLGLALMHNKFSKALSQGICS